MTRPLDTEQLRTTLDKIRRECDSFLSDQAHSTTAVHFARWVRWRVEQELREGWNDEG